MEEELKAGALPLGRLHCHQGGACFFVQSPRNDYGPLKDCPSGKWEAFLLEAGVLRLNLGPGPAPAFFAVFRFGFLHW